MSLARGCSVLMALMVVGTACSVSVDPTQETVGTIDADASPTAIPEAVTPTALPVDAADGGGEGDGPVTEGESPAEDPPPASPFAALAPGQYRVEVERILGHDGTAFSQGLKRRSAYSAARSGEKNVRHAITYPDFCKQSRACGACLTQNMR